MICEYCRVKGKESRVIISPDWVTLVYSPPFYDEEGRFHNHDPNSATAYYSCTNGHCWRGPLQRACTTCGPKIGKEAP